MFPMRGRCPPGDNMSTMLGNASRAREIARLFEVWRHACDLQDHDMMVIAKRAIDAAAGGKTPSAADMMVIKNYLC